MPSTIDENPILHGLLDSLTSINERLSLIENALSVPPGVSSAVREGGTDHSTGNESSINQNLVSASAQPRDTPSLSTTASIAASSAPPPLFFFGATRGAAAANPAGTLPPPGLQTFFSSSPSSSSSFSSASSSTAYTLKQDVALVPAFASFRPASVPEAETTRPPPKQPPLTRLPNKRIKRGTGDERRRRGTNEIRLPDEGADVKGHTTTSGRVDQQKTDGLSPSKTVGISGSADDDDDNSNKNTSADTAVAAETAAAAAADTVAVAPLLPELQPATGSHSCLEALPEGFVVTGRAALQDELDSWTIPRGYSMRINGTRSHGRRQKIRMVCFRGGRSRLRPKEEEAKRGLDRAGERGRGHDHVRGQRGDDDDEHDNDADRAPAREERHRRRKATTDRVSKKCECPFRFELVEVGPGADRYAVHYTNDDHRQHNHAAADLMLDPRARKLPRALKAEVDQWLRGAAAAKGGADKDDEAANGGGWTIAKIQAELQRRGYGHVLDFDLRNRKRALLHKERTEQPNKRGPETTPPP
ncbi:hypothetical protein SPI_01101 [Niveomyces insectorum RCEF 264]|uniref:Uncharacterized protein n=1 Tax=Niveomyces insectorum RCEF 264 TaxID=1081102 RepID=A0A167YNU4_9HYPO|nr:hypothetical protein SPI_01101 [Niveomyces insectorum RCEF 264]